MSILKGALERLLTEAQSAKQKELELTCNNALKQLQNEISTIKNSTAATTTTTTTTNNNNTTGHRQKSPETINENDVKKEIKRSDAPPPAKESSITDKPIPNNSNNSAIN